MSKHVLHVISGLGTGGAESVLARLCMSDVIWRHTIVSLTDAGTYGPVLQQRGIRVICLGMQRGRVSLRGMWKLWLIIKREGPSVVQCWMYHADLLGGIVARSAGIRAVAWNIRHSELEPTATSLMTRAVAKVCAMLSRLLPKAIIVCGEHAAKVHQRYGYYGAKMRIIENGYDLNHLRPDPESRMRIRRELGVPKGAPLVGYVARYNPQKDHATLLNAAHLLWQRGVNFSLALAGPGLVQENSSLSSEIRQAAAKKKVLLLGEQRDVRGIMSALDVHVMSSRYGEGFPNVVAEAMACGTPCISTDVGDARRIVGDSGWLVMPGSPSSLADTIETALSEFRLGPAWKSRQVKAREAIRNKFALETMVTKYDDVWASLEATA